MEKLEPMAAFFERRLEGYDAHMLGELEGAREFYEFTARQLPLLPCARVLDLGCGTGLELERYLRINPTARIDCIDISQGMLAALEAKLANYDVKAICADYFKAELGDQLYDAAVSVESLHHFSAARKTALYRRLRAALKAGGYFVLTDYMAESPEREAEYFETLATLKRAQGIADDAYYHYDTPLTPEHEKQALLDAGFTRVTELARWENTYAFKAEL